VGQYWKVVNLDKREYVDPHRLGCGLKLWEQLANHPGTGAALVVLCAAMPETRGGGDLALDSDVSKRTIGRWAGNCIALVGDYSELKDLWLRYDADLVYYLCDTAENIRKFATHWTLHPWTDDPDEADEYEDKARRLLEAQPYRDISDDVCAVIEQELHGQYQGDGWRKFVT